MTVSTDFPELPDRRALLAIQERPDPPEFKDLKATRDIVVSPVTTVFPEKSDVLVNPELPDQREDPEAQDLKVFKVSPESQADPDHLDPMDQPDHRVWSDLREDRETKVSRDFLVRWVALE